MRARVVDDPRHLSYNKDIYGNRGGMSADRHEQRFTQWCMWAKRNGFSVPEFLLPQIHVDTDIGPFTFEQDFLRNRLVAPSRDEINALGPWAYHVEIGDTSTVGKRRDGDWKFHRFRKSLLIDTAKDIVGSEASSVSVLDIGCHCGVFSLEFAAQGFGTVTGIDLRASNIKQANFLKDVFAVRDCNFSELNARDILRLPPADVTLCIGLFYHVTFPMELLKNLFELTNDFLIFDSLCQHHPFSAFHLVFGKDVNHTTQGEFHYQFNPTYRAICEGLQAVGFKRVYELFGSKGDEVNLYSTGNRRTFIATKTDNSLATDFFLRASQHPAL